MRLGTWSSFCSALLFSLSLHAAVKISGDGTDTSFTFTIGSHAYDLVGDLFYIGAGTAVTGNTYAIAQAPSKTNDGDPGFFSPITPATGTVNGVNGQVNPLYAQKIPYLGLSTYRPYRPFAVTASAPRQVHFMSAISTNASEAELLSTPIVSDAGGNETDGIVALCAGHYGTTNNENQYCFVAVKPNGGSFGEADGGIAAIKLSTTYLDVLNANTGISQDNIARELDTTATVLRISEDLSSIQANTVDMHFNTDLQRLYVALQVTGSTKSTAGVRAVTVGRMNNDILTFDPIGLDAVFANEDKIVGGIGSSAQVSIHKVRTLKTSTHLHYLIIVGGNGAPSATGNTVYALPLVNKKPAGIGTTDTALAEALTNPEHGTLALNSSDITEKYAMNGVFVDRGFTTTVQNASDMLTTTSTAAQVGGGALPLAASQTVSDIVARRDIVMVTIGDAYDATTQSGAFSSHALFDSQGRIKGWTPWERITGTDEKIFGIESVNGVGTYWMLTGTNSELVYTASVTQWSGNDSDGLLGGTASDATVGLSQQLGIECPVATGGIHNVFDFARTTSGFGDLVGTPNNQLSMIAVVGFDKVVLAETGRNSAANVFRANTGDFYTAKQSFTDGTLTGFVVDDDTHMLSISGGILDSIGPLTSAEVSRTPLSGITSSGYLFVGGAGGVAVLSKADNSGWDTSAAGGGLHARFSGLTSGMSFKQLGSYSFVQKLISDGTYLYVLMHNKLDRITLSTIASGSPTIVTLADASGIHNPDYVVFTDFGVSNKLGLLATSVGLFRVGNGLDITDSSVADSDDLNWTRVNIPEGLGAVSRLLFFSPSGHETGFALGGMVYVLSGFVGYDQARINRFSVADISSSSISDTTVQPLPDRFFTGVDSFLIEMGTYRNFIATDGINTFNSRSKSYENPDSFLYSYFNLRSGSNYLTSLPLFVVQNNAGNAIASFPNTNVTTIRPLVLNSAAGGWLLSGSFGCMTNE
ncbi:hypothetical protein JW872_01310 [Candidatus Babeliales bacterium]|nr:hypothetical protein [Candidatus Babeliales bacterium]